MMERTINDLCACCRRGTRTRWTVMLLFTMLLSSVTAWADTYKITFHLNGGTYEYLDINSSYEDGEDSNLFKPYRDDIESFDGWYTTKTFDEGTRIVDVKGRTGDLEVWAKWTCDPVTYIDENGTEQTITEYIELDGSTKPTKDDSYNWYVVRGENVVYSDGIACTGGDMHLILMDGAKLITKGTNALQSAGSIFIYGQSEGTGQLVATSNSAFGIYSPESITINGGTINATGGDFGISSIEGNVTINGGTVTAHGKDYFGIDAPNVTINGGSVTATSDTYHGISVNGTGTIAINGGSVNVSHGSSIDIPYYGIVKIQPGKAFTTGTDNTIYCGTLTEDELKAIDSKTLQPITWDGGNSAETAYVLTKPKHLELLAQCVNGGNDFSGKFFKLGGDITFDDATLTIDNDGDGTPESNHIAIGDETHAFAGTFDGQNYTINGLRITSASRRQGLFGSLGSTGAVKNVNLSDASIAGNDYTAGIVAHNSGKVTNCQVDNTVALHCAQNDYDSFGGIVGYNAPNGIVSECTSSVTVTVADGVTAINHFGGVVGNNNSTVNGCLAVGVVIPDVNHHGAVVGLNQSDGALTANYYTACTVAGVENATNVGCNSTDLEGAKSIHTLALGKNVSTSTPATVNYNAADYYAQGTQVTLTTTADDQSGYTLTYGNGNVQAVDNAGQFLMPAADVAVCLTQWEGEGTEASPYIIAFTTQLDLLATNVNNGNDYSGKFFKLGADITYSTAGLAETESNYTPVGCSSGENEFLFKGTLDGDGHTVSGIRIYRGEANGNVDSFQALIGILGDGGTVKNVTLADTRITGFCYVGGIVGSNRGTVTNCYVLNTVNIHSVKQSAAVGGVVGENRLGTISRCISAATLSVSADVEKVYMFGGVVGLNGGSLHDCLAIGATVPVADGYGAIYGDHRSNNVAHNYYTGCSVAGTPMASGIGYGGKDSSLDYTANDGAVPALRDGADNSTAIELLAQVPEAFKPFKVSLAGRTLYKDGNWNTLCLPFDVNSFDGTPFEDATVNTLSSSKFSNGTLTLNFSDAPAIKAGKPYIVKWDSGDNVENPVFENVTINGDSNTSTETDAVTFQGLYSPLSIAAEDNTMLYMGAGNTLYYPNGEMTIGAFRAYFRLANGITAGDLSSAQGAMIVLNFDGEETTGIENLNPAHAPEGEGSWFTLDGRRINGRPSQRGIYINNGKKVVIK